MTGATVQLFEIMESNARAKDFIQNSWNALYNDIYNHKDRWEELDEISAFAIQDLFLEGIA